MKKAKKENFTFSLSPELREKLQAAADKKEITISAYLRLLILETLG